MSTLQHYLNSLHVFCFLLSIGISRKKALSLARKWEKYAHPILYWGWEIPAYQPVPIERDDRWRR